MIWKAAVYIKDRWSIWVDFVVLLFKGIQYTSLSTTGSKTSYLLSLCCGGAVYILYHLEAGVGWPLGRY